ncbi:MAG: cupin [Actinomycetota bacterium]
MTPETPSTALEPPDRGAREALVTTPAGFSAAVDHFGDTGYRMELLVPADDPVFAVLVRDGERVTVRRERNAPAAPAFTGLDEPEIVRADEEAWGTGRAGMRYRDLIPSRLGGRLIASHIEVCDGGPVPDLVHHHAVHFQIIFCQYGWVDVVYEDQGPAFRMEAGDCVLQPPHIRHRVLASSAGARVVELADPAEHDTLFDHDLELPMPETRLGRRYGGQAFVHHVAASTPWRRDAGLEVQRTDIASATNGRGSVNVVRATPDHLDHEPMRSTGSDGMVDFLFVLDGSMTLTVDETTIELAADDAISIDPGRDWSLRAGDGLRLLRVQL